MKRTNIWLTVVAVLAGTVSAWAGEPGQSQGYKNSLGYTAHVGDLSNTPHHHHGTSVVKQPAAQPSFATAPACGPQGCTTSCDSACDELYDDGCDSISGNSGCLTGLFGRKLNRGGSGRTWGRVEALLWWAEDRDSPALISSNANFATRPVVPDVSNAGTSVLFGGQDGIQSDMMVGNRIDFGSYLDDDHSFGIGGRIYGLWNGADTVSVSSNGSGPSYGVPFFDVAAVPPVGPGLGVAIGTFGLLPIGQDLGGGQVVTGNVSATSELDFIGSEVYARALLARTADFRVDLIGGYTFHSLDDSIILQGRSTLNNTVAGNLTPQNIYDFRDAFEAENTFHGGQIGFETQVAKGRFMFSSLTKVHLGNMNQRVRLSGNSQYNDMATTISSNNRGLLVQGNNGLYERDQFTFAPEANVKLGYRVCKCATVNVGYSLMMWSDVALAGNHIDNRIDSTRTEANLNTATRTEVPNFEFNTDSFFMHGLDLGLTFTY
ncbi:hypothetical protein EC9_23100 [Rosistilla ulvae]|uniref:Legionella pneumophila major outer membrane protein n=1 Tax=Rosistilla ulvae TaxID=1930277 RepID=A0A517LZS3_9BACT|nr:BBP7 family outer membrane beta-barrel protein [Rosistilla ulvae]QDS88123.1 hypothetical protein EC9_23100 [Rosistilla ulvae]